jgi:hypothetical protein
VTPPESAGRDRRQSVARTGVTLMQLATVSAKLLPRRESLTFSAASRVRV